MSTADPLEGIAQSAMAGALTRGVDGVRAVAARGRSVSVTYRKGRADKVQESRRASLTLHLYCAGRYTTCTSSDLRPGALAGFLDSAVAMVKAMVPDPARQMPDPALYAGRQERDLALFDAAISACTPAERDALARATEAAALEAAGARVLSAEATWEDDESEFFQVHSNGFAGSQRESQFWLSAEVSLADENDRKPSGWDVAGARWRARLPDPAVVGSGAAERARQCLGAHKVDTRRAPMIVENRAVGRLLGQLLGALRGRAVQQQQSFLAGKQGQRIASEVLHLVDDPFLPAGFGSRLFDSEGIAARVLPVIERGVLQNYFIDTYYARKLGVPPTTGDGSNLVLAPGTRSLDELIAAVGDGILVRGFIGGNTNPVTGDFSLGIFGTLIENGQLGPAVSEMNISGSHLDLWQRLQAAGNDVWPYSSLLAPSLVFDGVQFSGS